VTPASCKRELALEVTLIHGKFYSESEVVDSPEDFAISDSVDVVPLLPQIILRETSSALAQNAAGPVTSQGDSWLGNTIS
jgi:hypothetical protein